MSILFNSVKTYVESVGRQRSINHWNTLDSAQIIQTGPTASIESWIPKVGAKNQFYPALTFDSAQTVAEVAGVTTLRCNYVGKYDGMGQPSVGSSTHQGEISWTSFQGLNIFVSVPEIPRGGYSGTQTDADGNPIPAVPPVYGFEFVSYTWLARFIVTTQIYKTLTKYPSADIGSGGGSIRVTNQFRTGRVSTNNGAGMIIAILTFPTVLIDSNCNPLNNGWYEVTSTWGPQAQIVTTLQDQPTPDILAINSLSTT